MLFLLNIIIIILHAFFFDLYLLLFYNIIDFLDLLNLTRINSTSANRFKYFNF